MIFFGIVILFPYIFYNPEIGRNFKQLNIKKRRNMETINEMNYLDMEKLSKYVHLSKSTIYKMVCNKSIPYVKLGTRTLFVKGQIDNWVLNGGKISPKLPVLSKF